jgi:HEAT repeat protein
MLWLTLKDLRSKDLSTRDKAFATATRNSDIEALLHVIEDADQYVRDSAIKALGEIGDVKALPALIKRLDDANFNNQEHAAAALAKIGDDKAVRPLAAMLRDAAKHPQARRAAADALTTLGDARVTPLLLDALQGHDTEGRILAFHVVGSLCDARAVPAAIAALRDADLNVRLAAAEMLGQLREARAVEPLVDLLKREQRRSRDPIVEALGRISDARAAPALVALLGDDDDGIREKAADALDAVGWQPSDDTTRASYHLARQSWDDLSRMKAAAVPVLIAHLLDFSGTLGFRTTISKESLKLLQHIGWSPATAEERAVFAAAHGRFDAVEREGAAAVDALLACYRNGRRYERMSNAVKSLENTLKSYADGIDDGRLGALDMLADLKGSYDKLVETEGADWHTTEFAKVDCARVRDLARQELERRRKR